MNFECIIDTVTKLPFLVLVGGPIAIGFYLIYKTFSAPKKKRIVSILAISFALTGWISFYSYNAYVSFCCVSCGTLTWREYDRVNDAMQEYLFSPEYISSENKKLPTLNDLAESVGYIPPEERKSSPLNPCVQESDLSVIISGDVEDIRILVYSKEEWSCRNVARIGGKYLRFEEACAYLYGEDHIYYDDCNEKFKVTK